MPRLEIRPSGSTPRGCFSSARKGGGVEPNRTRTRAVPEMLHWRTRPQFFGQIFWEKILETKIVLLASPRRGCYASAVLTAPDRTAVLAPLVTIFIATHPATPPATAPASLRIYSARRLARHASLACQPSISCS